MPKTFWISTGNSRKELSWKNVELSWEDFVERLKKPIVGHDSVKEYNKLPKEIQAIRKDVGCYLGGAVSGGRRLKNAVNYRSMLTLDVDFADGDFWEDFQQFFKCAAFVHGTRKHLTPDREGKLQYRYRLIIPLAREVQADEYEAAARKVAELLEIELFDPTTFQPSRLMYWPNVSSDQKYYYREQTGSWLDPDAVLRLYKDWKDESQWAYHAHVVKQIQNDAANQRKQANPLEKPGLIGAFCRTYGIQDAISKYLSEDYLETDKPDRYTYAHGSTAAGLVVYDDIFAYSHHGTDPGSGKLMNAWDLVRIHKFRDQDAKANPRTSEGKKPSQKLMFDLAAQDSDVMALHMDEKFEAAKQWFVEEVEVEEAEDKSWITLLKADKKTGIVLTCVENIRLILHNDKRLKGRLRFNDLYKQLEVVKPLQWDKDRTYPRVWTDDDLNQLRCLMALPPYELQRTPKLEDCMSELKENNRYHPIKEYLESLEWDGIERINHLLEDYLGCESSDYIQAVTRKAFLAAVGRIYQPGIKFDYILTFVGVQGIGKSTLIRKMSKGWFSDTFNFHMIGQGNKAYEQLQGNWLIEIGEMAGLRKAEVEAAKSFLSSTQDKFRPAYGREIMVYPRGMVFFGSSNNGEFLKRASGGNRRFWPADCGRGAVVKNIWKELDSEVDQIWAELVEYWKAGESLELSPELEIQARKIQEEHEEGNDLEGLIREFLDVKIPATWEQKTVEQRMVYFKYFDDESEQGEVLRTQICAGEIWCECLKKPRGDMNHSNTKFIHEILQQTPGWEIAKSKREIPGYGRVKTYIRGSDSGS